MVYKNDLIQELSESLNQSVMERKDLLEQIDQLKEKITQLQEQLQETTKMVIEHKCNVIAGDTVDNALINVSEKFYGRILHKLIMIFLYSHMIHLLSKVFPFTVLSC